VTVSAKSNTTEQGAQLWPLSVQAYRALGELGLIPENTELLYGQVFQKMAKSPLHSYLLPVLQEVLQTSVSVDYLVRTEQPISCRDSEPEPDLAVVRGGKEDFRTEHPRTAELVIEVCVTTHEYDRSKVRAYAQAAVKELWLVLGPEKQIEVYRRPVGDQFAERIIHGPGGDLSSAAVSGISVELDRLFC